VPPGFGFVIIAFKTGNGKGLHLIGQWTKQWMCQNRLKDPFYFATSPPYGGCCLDIHFAAGDQGVFFTNGGFFCSKKRLCGNAGEIRQPHRLV